MERGDQHIDDVVPDRRDCAWRSWSRLHCAPLSASAIRRALGGMVDADAFSAGAHVDAPPNSTSVSLLKSFQLRKIYNGGKKWACTEIQLMMLATKVMSS